MGFVALDQPEPPRRGFIPLADNQPARGFTPIEPERPSMARTIALENPLAAIGETGLNLASQAVALPVAGLAGLATEAGNALGLTQKTGADVVHSVGEAMTYQPRGEMGKAATELATYPFQKLAEAGQYLGGQTLDATGSPLAATVVDTAINALPMAVGPIKKGAVSLKDRIAGKGEPTPEGIALDSQKPKEAPAVPDTTRTTGNAAGVVSGVPEQRGFVPLKEEGNAEQASGRTGRMEANDQALPRSEGQGFQELRGQGNQSVSRVAPELQGVSAGRRSEAEQQRPDMAGPDGYQWGLSAGERGLGAASTADHAPQVLSPDTLRQSGTDDRGSRAGNWDATNNPQASGASSGRQLGAGDAARSAAVPEQFAVRDMQRGNLERAGVGEAIGRETSDLAGTTASRGGAGAGAAIGRPAETGFVPLRDSIDAAAHEAATSPLNNLPEPSQAQIESGNYKKGAIKLHGLDIAIENPKGSVRAGVSPQGKPWQTAMQDHYGYVKRTIGKDGDQLDVFIGDKPSSDRVFVVDQIDPKTGKFDEHKAVVGAESLGEARAIYQRNYEPGWRGAGAITEMSADGFKSWLRDGNTQKPLSEVSPKVLNSWAPGANYAPLIDDARSPAGAASVADLPDPIRRESIIKDFTKALDSTIYEGRVKGKNRLGFFRPGVEEVRIKKLNDIEVAAHEMAHLIDHRIPEIAQAWKADKVLREELRSVSYDHKNVAEGFAEGMRLWMTQPDTLQARAPKVAAWLDDFAAKHAYGPALKKAQADMTGWFGQDALNRARSKIGQDKPLAEFLDRAFDKFRQSTVDDLHGIYQMERDTTGGKIMAGGAYETARLSRASASIADGAVRYGYPVKMADGSFKYAGRGLEEILRPVAGSMDDALLYFVGRSARELMQQGREHLFTQAEIGAMLKLRTPEFDQAFKDYQTWNRGILDFAEAQGVLNPDTRRMWKRTEYLPFHRVQQPGSLKGKPGDWSGVKALTGGTDNIRDVLGNMIGNAAQLIDVAVKNEARLKVAELASKPGGAKFMVKIDPESRPVKVSGSQVMGEMLKRYGIAIDGQPPAFFEFFLQGQPPAGGNVIAVLKGGKPVWYEVGDPILYRALSSLDRAPMHWLTQWLGMPKRIGQVTITLTPDFMVANIARDTIMGAVMSRSGFRPVLDSLNGMRLRLKNDPLYKDYIANGGGLSSQFLDDHHFRVKLEKFYRNQQIDYRTVLDTPDKVLGAIESMADAFEMSTRLGEYKRAIDAGEHPRHAAFQGREVSTDFAMKGDSKALGFMYDTVMFLRPAVVSLDRLYRGVAHDPNRAAIGIKTAMIALSSVGLYLLNRDDPRYADLPDWDRDTHWHFFVGDQHFRYPKIWEIGAVASTAERAVERLMEADPAGLGKDFARIVGNTFSLNFMPQILAPITEQMANRNSFTKAPIETPGMENVQPFLRAKPNTSETMRALGMATRNLPESMQVNPVRTEALLRGYLNTWAAYGLMLTDKAFFADAGPAMRTDELPVVRRFYSQEPAKHTKFETQFYDMLGEAKRLQGTLRELDKQGRPEIADEKEKSPLAGESKPLERAQQNIRAINNEMMKTHRDKDLTPDARRQRIDELIAEKNRLLKATVQDAEAAQKGRK